MHFINKTLSYYIILYSTLAATGIVKIEIIACYHRGLWEVVRCSLTVTFLTMQQMHRFDKRHYYPVSLNAFQLCMRLMIILVALSSTFTQMNFSVHSNWNAIYLNAIQIPDVGSATKI